VWEVVITFAGIALVIGVLVFLIWREIIPLLVAEDANSLSFKLKGVDISRDPVSNNPYPEGKVDSVQILVERTLSYWQNGQCRQIDVAPGVEVTYTQLQVIYSPTARLPMGGFEQPIPVPDEKVILRAESPTSA
jgi:hypothetical protein